LLLALFPSSKPPYRFSKVISSGTPELGVAGGAAAPVSLYQGGKGAKVPFQFSELSEMLVQFFYEFASENARNAVIKLQE
jgi:hypothetical protein